MSGRRGSSSGYGGGGRGSGSSSRQPGHYGGQGGSRQSHHQHIGGSRGGRHHQHHSGGGHQGQSQHTGGGQPTAAQVAQQATEAAINAANPQLAAYLQHWHPLVNMELAAEQQVVNERLASWPLPHLQREGLVLLGLTAAKRGSLYGSPIWVLRQQERGQLPYHRFTAGDEVLISKGHPLHGPGKPFTGTVLDRGGWDVRVVSNDKLPTDGTQLRLDKGVNTVVYERMRAALNSLVKPPPEQQSTAAAGPAAAAAATSAGDNWPLLITNQLQQQQQQGGEQQQRRRSGKRQRQQEDADTSPPGTILAGLLVTPSPAAAAGPSTLMPPAAVEWARGVLTQRSSSQGGGGLEVLAARDVELGLNRSQVAAIANCIVNRLSLIHGPPGTGKTTTTVALLAQLVTRFQLQTPVLAVAQSHVAVDNLLEGLVDAGVSAVRLGQPVKVRESLRNATLDALLEAHPKSREVEEAAQQLQELRYRLPTLSGRDRGLGHRDAAQLSGRVAAMKEELVAEVLKGAQVICATCAAAGSDMVAGAIFPLVVLDEASQAAEPEALIPLTRGAQHVVLVGDHMQLPPVCNSKEAAAAGLATSLFERLMVAGVPSAMLQVQYRMHPCLSAFPNLAFYGSNLADGVTAEQRPGSQPFPWPQPNAPLLFIDVVDGREEVASGGSKLNRSEAAVVEKVLMHLLTVARERRGAVGVVTPYLAQLNLLQQQLSHLTAPLQQGAAEAAAGAPDAAAGGLNGAAAAGSDVLEIKTVDGYQGREKEVVVFSCVRANPQSQVGFLEDWRRLNVAITRPRRGLIIVGHAATLATGDERWARYLEWLQQRSCVVAASQIQQHLVAAR